VTFADRSAFSNVLTVSHKFRYCGHRFHLNDQACHTVLPLLLTSSHHNALLTPPSAPGSLEGEQPPTLPLPKYRPRYRHLTWHGELLLKCINQSVYTVAVIPPPQN